MGVIVYNAPANWTTTGNPTVTISSFNAGDDIVIIGGIEGATSNTLAVPTATGVTFSLITSTVVGGESAAYLWKGTATASGTSVVATSTHTGTGQCGLQAWVRSGTSTSTITLTGNNTEAGYSQAVTQGSDVIVGWFDFLAVAAGFTPATGSGTATERQDTQSASHYTIWSGDWTDVATGTFTFGTSAYTGTQVAQVGIVLLPPAPAPRSSASSGRSLRKPYAAKISSKGNPYPPPSTITNIGGTTFVDGTAITAKGQGFGASTGSIWLADGPDWWTANRVIPSTVPVWDENTIGCTLNLSGLTAGTNMFLFPEAPAGIIGYPYGPFTITASSGPTTSIDGLVPVTVSASGSKIVTSGGSKVLVDVVGNFAGSKIVNSGASRLVTNVGFSVTGAKVVATSANFATPVTARATTTKIGLTSTRALVTPTYRSTVSKIGLTSTNIAHAITARATGTPVSGTPSTSVLFQAPINFRASGAKLVTSGAVRLAVPIVERATVAKIVTTSALFEVPTFFKPNTVKIGLTSTLMSTPVIARATTVKIGFINVGFPTPITSRASGTKIVTSGAIKVAVPVFERTTLAKIALNGSTRLLSPITATISGTSSSITQAISRWLVTANFKASGTKISTSGATIISLPIVQRSTATKIGLTSTAIVVNPTARATTTKIVTSGSLRFSVNTTARTSFSKITTSGAVRLSAPVNFRSTSSKIVKTSVRLIVPTYISAFRHIGTAPIARYKVISTSGPKHITVIGKQGIYVHNYSTRSVTYNSFSGTLIDD